MEEIAYGNKENGPNRNIGWIGLNNDFFGVVLFIALQRGCKWFTFYLINLKTIWCLILHLHLNYYIYSTRA